MSPNRDTGDVEVLVLSQLPTENSCFLAGDFNGHSALWDTVQPSDSRGERIEEWIADNNLICSNDGTSTCTNRAPRTFFWRLPRWPAECPGTWVTTWDRTTCRSRSSWSVRSTSRNREQRVHGGRAREYHGENQEVSKDGEKIKTFFSSDGITFWVKNWSSPLIQRSFSQPVLLNETKISDLGG